MAVVSDTHIPQFAGRLSAALAHVAAERPEHIVHCGDLTDESVIAAFAAIAPVDAVAGNNDDARAIARFGRRKILELAGARIGVVHGDGRRGTTLERARAAFRPDAVDAIFFGHSHVPYCERHGDVWVVNPGSPTDKRREALFSFAVVEIEAGRCMPRLVTFGS